MKVTVVKLLILIITILRYMIFANIILSFIRGLNSTLDQLGDAIDAILSPLFKPLRRVVPVIDLGGVGFDLTPLVALLILGFVGGILTAIVLALPF